MGLQTPRLDDRSFEDIVEEARRRIALYTPEWTDHNLSDPGITLIELFAWMVDIVLYRLNRVPDKHFIKFMELIGMQLHEAVPARVPITFWLSTPQDTTMVIPSGTEVATLRTETEPAIVFTTDGMLEVSVPNLSELMTSSTGDEGRRVFAPQNIFNVQSGFDGFPAFASNPPQSDDAVYFGFDDDLSNLLLGFNIEVDTAQGAGIDPENPPYVWEVLSTEVDTDWVPVEIDIDETLGLNQSGLVRLHLPPMRRGVRNDRTAYWVRLRLQVDEDDEDASVYDVSPTIRRLEVNSWGGTVSATNVTRVYNEVLGRSDGSPGQRFYLEHSPLVARTTDEFLMIRHDDGREDAWQEISDFSTSRPNDTHYTIDSNSGEIRLGPAIQQPDGTVRLYGEIPPKDTMVLMTGYRYGGGQLGNVSENAINVLKTSLPYVSRVRNRVPAIGGRDAESLEHAKMRVPGVLRSLQRAVTPSDFEYLTREAAPGEVGRVYCLQPPLTNRGEIRILVIPAVPRLSGYIAPESLVLSPELQENIQKYLDERRLLSTVLDISEPSYQWVDTDVQLRVSANYDREKVLRAAEKRLIEFLNPLIGGVDGQGWQFGRELFVSDVTSVLLTVPGVHFVRSVRLFQMTYDNGQFSRERETEEIAIPSHGVIVSHQHNLTAI